MFQPVLPKSPPLLQFLTSPEHVLPLQQLDDGCLRGGDQDDAAVLAAAHQAALRRDVHAGRHLATQKTQMRVVKRGATQLCR